MTTTPATNPGRRAGHPTTRPDDLSRVGRALAARTSTLGPRRRPGRVRRVGVALAAVATLLLGAACSGSAEGSSTTTTTETTAPDATAPASSTAPDPDDPTFAEVRARVGELVEEHELDGAGFIVFDRTDGFVFEDYWGGIDADHLSFIASATKMITAGVLSRLADQGLLDLDAPIVDYVDWATDNPDVTVAHLLSHSSGLVGLMPELAYLPYICQLVGDDLRTCGEEIFNTPDDDADVVPPDTEFRYGGGQWQVAGAVAETVSGKTWDELVHETYIEPCGVDSLGYNNHWTQFVLDYPTGVDPTTLEPTGNPHMEGGAFIDAPDYATLLLMHLRGGECPNGRVLSEEAVEKAHTDRTGPPTDGESPSYGIGWWIDEEAGRTFNNGAYGAAAWLDDENGYGAYLVIEESSGIGSSMASELHDLVEEAVLARR